MNFLFVHFDDPIFNPLWRQSSFVIPQAGRLGLVCSTIGDTVTVGLSSTVVWNFEMMSLAHILLSGLLVIAAIWHWAC